MSPGESDTSTPPGGKKSDRGGESALKKVEAGGGRAQGGNTSLQPRLTGGGGGGVGERKQTNHKGKRGYDEMGLVKEQKPGQKKSVKDTSWF